MPRGCSLFIISVRAHEAYTPGLKLVAVVNNLGLAIEDVVYAIHAGSHAIHALLHHYLENMIQMLLLKKLKILYLMTYVISKKYSTNM